MVRPNNKYVRYVILKFEHFLHRSHPWIVVDLLEESATFHSSKQASYQYVQSHKRFFDGWIDITEEKDNE